MPILLGFVRILIPDSRIPGFRILGRMKFCPHTEEDCVTVMLLLFVRRLFP